MRLDSSALMTLNIFPAEKIKDKVSSIFGLLNNTITAGMGERLLRRWLRQPLVSTEAINKRLDVVQLFIEETELRSELRINCLKGIVDVEKMSRRLENRVRFRLQDLYVMYQAVRKLDSIIVFSLILQLVDNLESVYSFSSTSTWCDVHSTDYRTPWLIRSLY